MNRPIGVFDSGIGGLTVVKEIIKKLPKEDIIYFGDTAHLPYGTKSKETIIRFSLENILFLLKKQVKIIVIACNTSSSIALPVIRSHFKVPLIGVITPGAKEAVYATKNKRIGIIGTRATIESKSYNEEIRKIDPSVEVFSVSCPLFVPLVEEGWVDSDITFNIAKKYLAPFKKAKVDTLILGCTHYPLLSYIIKKTLGKDITLIDSTKQVSLEVKQILSNEGLLNSKKTPPRYTFYVSDEPILFKRLAKRFLGYGIKDVRKVNV